MTARRALCNLAVNRLRVLNPNADWIKVLTRTKDCHDLVQFADEIMSSEYETAEAKGWRVNLRRA